MQVLARGMLRTSCIASACSKEASKTRIESGGLAAARVYHAASKQNQRVRQQALWESSNRHPDDYVSQMPRRSLARVAACPVSNSSGDIPAAAKSWGRRSLNCSTHRTRSSGTTSFIRAVAGEANKLSQTQPYPRQQQKWRVYVYCSRARPTPSCCRRPRKQRRAARPSRTSCPTRSSIR